MFDQSSTPVWRFLGGARGGEWPAPGDPAANLALSMQYQLAQSEWLSANRLQALQFRQLSLIARHAYASVPFYRERWMNLFDPVAALTPEAFAGIPLLRRADLQNHFDALTSTAPPAAHGKPRESRTSGSTGSPVRVLKTPICGLMWNAFALRDHFWRARDLSGKLAGIRQGVTTGNFSGWGSATDGVVATGPAVVRGIGEDAASQLEWLLRERPDYLITHPSMAAELARLSIERGIRLEGLREVRTFGELLDEDTRVLCRDAWDVPVTDTYSTTETGYIALQCPRHEHYHVQSEGVLVEILDDAGQACAPGEVGRVVVTDLHNFAMPLIRYDVGDFAEVGVPCDCGRGLPVLRRVIGRVRNMLTTADGRRFWPAIGSRAIAEAGPIRQYQLVQKAFDLIEVRLVVAESLTASQEARVLELVQARLPVKCRIELRYCEKIARSAGGKFEDFMSEISAGARG